MSKQKHNLAGSRVLAKRGRSFGVSSRVSTGYSGAQEEVREDVRGSLAIVAGEGGLAAIVARACVARGEKPVVMMLPHQLHAPAECFFGCRVLFPVNAWTALRLARENAIRRVVFAGKYRRSSAEREGQRTSNSNLLAFFTRRLLSRYGDDRAMRRIAWLLRLFSIRVIAPQELCPALCASKAGALGRVRPTVSERRDIKFAKRVLDLLAPLDIGQSIVVCSGLVLGIETLAGTDAMLDGVRLLKKQRSIVGGVLVKLPKIGQRKDLDLPAIGVETLRLVARAGLRGIAVECHGALLIPPNETVAQADERSLFLYAVAARA